MIKIAPRVFRKRRWWDKHKGRMIKYRIRGRAYTWAIVDGFKADFNPDAPPTFVNWGWEALVKHLSDEGDWVKMSLSCHNIESLKILTNAEAMLFKLEMEIDYEKNS